MNGNRATENTSDTSNTASGTPSTMPRAPNSVTITNKGDRTLIVTWEPPDNDGGSAITKYKVQWMGDGEPSGPHLRTKSLQVTVRMKSPV